MLKDNRLIGIISIYHQEVRPFTDKQIEFVRNFASQAVIAIENARLLDELRKSCSSRPPPQRGILRAISASPTNLERVFAVVAASATRLCDASDATIHQVAGAVLRQVAHHGPMPIPTLPMTRGVLAGRPCSTGKPSTSPICRPTR